MASGAEVEAGAEYEAAASDELAAGTDVYAGATAATELDVVTLEASFVATEEPGIVTVVYAVECIVVVVASSWTTVRDD